MMALRELMVFEHEGRYVTIGGNQRLEALRSLKIAEAPCKVIPADTTPEQLNAYIVLDNAPFGEWGVDFPHPEEEKEKKGTGERKPKIVIECDDSDEQLKLFNELHLLYGDKVMLK